MQEYNWFLKFALNLILAIRVNIQSSECLSCSRCLAVVTGCGDFACVEIWVCFFVLIKDVIYFNYNGFSLISLHNLEEDTLANKSNQSNWSGEGCFTELGHVFLPSLQLRILFHL